MNKMKRTCYSSMVIHRIKQMETVMTMNKEVADNGFFLVMRITTILTVLTIGSKTTPFQEYEIVYTWGFSYVFYK